MCPLGPRSTAPVLGIAALAASLALAACAPRPVVEPAPKAAQAGVVFTVRQLETPALISTFAVVQSPDAAIAQARISGILSSLLVDEGDTVRQGQLIAVVSNESLAPQAAASRAQASSVRAQLKQAEADLERFAALNAQGYYPTRSLEAARANAQALREQVRALDAQAASVTSVQGQGRILAPVTGRVLQVPVTAGSAVTPGTSVAMIGSAYVLRVKQPERAAGALRPGATIYIERGAGRVEAAIAKVYPALADGRVEADVLPPAGENLIYGQRIRVWTPGESSAALIVPSSYLQTRYGVDFARVLNGNGTVEEVVVRRGEPRALPGLPDGVEILAGLKAGDRLVR